MKANHREEKNKRTKEQKNKRSKEQKKKGQKNKRTKEQRTKESKKRTKVSQRKEQKQVNLKKRWNGPKVLSIQVRPQRLVEMICCKTKEGKIRRKEKKSNS